jgi:hypothetical protein
MAKISAREDWAQEDKKGSASMGKGEKKIRYPQTLSAEEIAGDRPSNWAAPLTKQHVRFPISILEQGVESVTLTTHPRHLSLTLNGFVTASFLRLPTLVTITPSPIPTGLGFHPKGFSN